MSHEKLEAIGRKQTQDSINQAVRLAASQYDRIVANSDAETVADVDPKAAELFEGLSAINKKRNPPRAPRPVSVSTSAV